MSLAAVALLVAALTVGGTSVQFWLAMTELRRSDPEGVSAFAAADDLRAEQSWIRHPVSRWRRNRDVRALLRARPDEWKRYWRIELSLFSWAALAGAALLAAAAAAVELAR